MISSSMANCIVVRLSLFLFSSCIELIWKVHPFRRRSRRRQSIVRSLLAKKGHPRIVVCVCGNTWKVSWMCSWNRVNCTVTCSRIGTRFPSARVMFGVHAVVSVRVRHWGRSSIFFSVSCDMTLTEAPVSTSALRVTSPTLSWRYPSRELCVLVSSLHIPPWSSQLWQKGGPGKIGRFV